MSIQCNGCNCTFFTKTDLEAHLTRFGSHKHQEAFTKIHRKIEYGSLNQDAPDEESAAVEWRKSQFDSSEYTLATSLPNISTQVKIKGTLKDGFYVYTLSKDGKWLKRKHV